MRRFAPAAVSAALILSAVAPAAAADEIGVSRDGRRWSATLTEPLFDPGTRWVPGDTRTVSFYVRNQALTHARLVATVRSDDGDDLWAGGDVTMRARVQGKWFTLRNGRPSGELTQESLRPSSAVRVDVRAKLEPASTNVSQASRLNLTLGLRLTDADEGVAGASAEAGDGGESGRSDGWLSRTGASTPAILIWLAAAATAVGAAFMAAGRREGDDEHA
ncbi:hypothetical protein GL325_03090 [Aeromicrobium sp. 636]|uniref:LPXTG cell wall anchor domain-containing protein n=1 Tax=Aeromicrobium senzhongii TaxID=2663859 RepID=A0A8I0ETG7_9ACTN|nr:MULTISPECIES: hypothetical protein [Aeromicrobium]MBC9225303.1 hypothetical protein [Aeromicrobium senzhongii]MCQ3997413.1 hypothetical protein [Aeromicrobium sp. 636]